MNTYHTLEGKEIKAKIISGSICIYKDNKDTTPQIVLRRADSFIVGEKTSK